jgi:hypothetical protein
MMGTKQWGGTRGMLSTTCRQFVSSSCGLEIPRGVRYPGVRKDR